MESVVVSSFPDVFYKRMAIFCFVVIFFPFEFVCTMLVGWNGKAQRLSLLSAITGLPT